MATSGTTTFSLDVADIIEEAYERLGMEMRTGYDLRTGRRSLSLLLQELSNYQVNLWKTDLTTQTMTEGTAAYTLGTSIIDIKNVVIRRDSVDVSMTRLDRAGYQNIPKKSTSGKPNQYWLDKTNTVILNVYPTPENSTDVIRFYALTRLEDLGVNTNTIDVPVQMEPMIIAGLTFYLALKRKPEVAQGMKVIYDELRTLTLNEDTERVSLRVVPNLPRVI